MSRSVRRSGLALAGLLIALGTSTVLALPAQAASSWSSPVQLPAGCGASTAINGGSVAVDAAGAEVAAGLRENADFSDSVLVCASANGQNWSAPVTLGGGVNPVVALAPNGRAVAAWEGGPSSAPVVQASVQPPGGTWSAPVTVSADARGPVIGIDGSGNAIIAWAGAAGTVHTASLPAGGSWTAVQSLATRASGVDLAVNSAGSVIITWAVTGGGTFADSGTVLGGFAAPVTVGTPPYKGGATRVALNNAGQAVLVWASGTANVAASRSAAGTWSTPASLSATHDGPLDVAIDGAGDAIAIFGQIHVAGSTATALVSDSIRPAGGTWGTPTALSVPGDATAGVRAVADSTGTFVVAWADTTTRTLSVLTSPPGGSFGPTATFAAAALGDLKIAPGHAVLTFGSAVSNEPVS